MLEVKFAEVNRTTGMDLQAGIGLDSLGSDLRANLATGGFGVSGAGATTVSQGAGTLLMNFAGNTSNALGANLANIFINLDHFTTALQFLETEGLARTLAEPRLVTISGKEASFLAGGEFPIPVPGENGTITIEF